MVGLALVIASLRYGDWKHWRQYEATLLYWAVCTLLYNVLTYTHPLWMYDSPWLPNHTAQMLFVVIVVYPPVLLIYLPRFPKRGLSRKLLYVVSWTVLATLLEWIFQAHFIYSNGWGLVWSLLLNFLMFIFLKLHRHKPLLTYALSVVAVIGFLVCFEVPVLRLR